MKRVILGVSLAASAACAALTACGGQAPTPEAPAAAPVPSAPATVLAPAPVSQAEPEPDVRPVTGRVEPVRHPDVTLAAATAEVFSGHLYLASRPMDPAGTGSVFESDAGGLVCRVAGARHGVAVASVQERLLRVRLVGAEPAPDELSITCESAADPPAEPAGGPGGRGTTQRFTLRGGAKADRKPARAAFFTALGDWLDERARISWSRHDTTLRFAANRARRMGADKLGPPDPRNLPVDRSDLGELMSLYTGLTSAEEALQTDRGLLIRPEAGHTAKARTVELKTLGAVPLPAHPWPKMIAEKKLRPVVEPLAALAPADALYLHFGDLRTFVALLKDVDAMLAPAARALEMSAGEWGLAERYERELCVERTVLSEKLGHLAARGVAVVVGDPLLREGTDLALLFDLENEALLNGALAGFAAAAKARRADLQESTVTVAGRPVSVLSTPDGEVRQHRLKVGNVVVVANGPSAVLRVLEAADGKRDTLAKSLDFQYFRGLYPHRKEAGFAFLSDAFVGRMTGPGFKIAAARRMEARADLLAISGAALLYGLLEGRPAPDAQALIQGGVLSPNELKHGDGAAISFDAARGPSSTWGRPGRMRSLADVVPELGRVTAGEKAAYEQFRDSYQTYWRGFIDPIGVEIVPVADAGGWRVDARLLPLIDGTDYNELKRITGGGEAVVPVTPEGIHWRLAIGPQSELRRQAEETGRHMPGLQTLSLSWLGDWVALGVLDRASVWSLLVAEGQVPASERSDRHHDSMQSLMRLPLYAEVQLRDRMAFAAFLTGLRTAMDQTAGGIVAWDDAGKHRDVPIVAVRERPNDAFPTGREGMALYYAIAGDVCILSLSRDALIARIDAASEARKTAGPDPRKAQVVLQYAPKSPTGWLNRAVGGLAEKSMEDAHTAALRAAWLLHAATPGLTPEARGERAMAYLGLVPTSPFGGRFSLDANGALTHDLLGTENAPVVPESPVAGGPLARFLDRLVRLAFDLSFEGQGDHHGLHVGLGWETK